MFLIPFSLLLIDVVHLQELYSFLEPYAYDIRSVTIVESVHESIDGVMKEAKEDIADGAGGVVSSALLCIIDFNSKVIFPTTSCISILCFQSTVILINAVGCLYC